MNILLLLKFNLILAIIFFIIPDYKKTLRILAPALALAGFVISIIIMLKSDLYVADYLVWDSLSRLIYFFTGFFGVLLAVYSAGFIKEKLNKYFSYFFLTLFSAYGIVLSGNWIAFTVFWGISGISLYLLMQTSPEANPAAKKTMIILGAGDSFLILAVAVLYKLTGSFSIAPAGWSLLAAVGLLIAGFAKAGNMPFHTWIPECADKAPIPVTAFLPASLDKLLGIYLLARTFSILNFTQEVKIAVMLTGAITILCAVYMALAQHSAKKLLSYHAVSQVGYMVLGIGTGNILGLAGALFHMLNNAVYKCLLFLGTGQVEKIKNTDNLEKLGNLAKFLPVTFVCMLIAALSISGVPPFNGFYSKWLIYQGVISLLTTTPYPLLTIICLIAALFGSALTLASFMKLIHAIFLGPHDVRKETQTLEREKLSLILPQVVLAIACIALGIFAKDLFIKPVFGRLAPMGVWFPKTAAIMILAGIILGILIYFISGIKIRRAKSYIGGENITPEMRISGVEFYSSIENIFPFRQIYALAAKKVFDIYEVMKTLLLYMTTLLKYLHNGVLNNYLAWIFAGGIIILLVIW